MHFIIITLLLIKIGLAPFHLWFISISKHVRRSIFIWIGIIQKLVPIFILSSVFKINLFLMLIMVIRMLISSLNILLQIKLIGVLAGSNKTEVFSQFALEFQVCVRCAFEGNIARLSAAGNGTLRHHLLFSRRKACYLLLEGVWYDRVRYMNELFEKYSKVQERRIYTNSWCARLDCLS